MTINETMTALADEIRELSGSNTAKGLDDMTTDVDVANAEIAEQAELLEQIATALEGKASGGSAEDLNTELTEQESLISQLSSILDSKASGGSGGDDVIAITIENSTGDPIYYWNSEGALSATSNSGTIEALSGITLYTGYNTCIATGEYTSQNNTLQWDSFRFLTNEGKLILIHSSSSN